MVISNRFAWASLAVVAVFMHRDEGAFTPAPVIMQCDTKPAAALWMDMACQDTEGVFSVLGAELGLK